MRLLSLNVWGGQVLDELLEYLSCVDADIYCLQEVFNASESMTTNMFEIMPNVRIDLFARLCEALSGHQGFFFPSCEKFPHYPEVGDIRVPYGIATFVRKGIPVIKNRVDFVHDTFRVLPRGDIPFPRNAHVFTIWDQTKSEPVTIAHMHGLWTYGGKMETPERTRQAHLFCNLIQDLQRTGKIIACGDWNVLPDSITFDILGDAGLHDLVVRSGFTSTRTSHYKKEGPQFADYMCVSNAVHVNRFDIVSDPEVSDHRPLLLDFE